MKSRSNRLPTISADDWGDEYWVVDCVCGVDFDDGEEMVDCDECGVWVHTRCCSYVKSKNMFTCDKCKSKKLRNESEETEVAQLLVELPTKTLRMDSSPYAVSSDGGDGTQSLYQVLSEVPLEKKVHVQGVPGGDPGLFSGVSSMSMFTPELWKCKGYVPKKFNSQYREFPCWDVKREDDDDDKNEIATEEVEKRVSNGADALFSLSKENGGVETQVNGGSLLGMGSPIVYTKAQEVESNEGRQHVNVVKKEQSLTKPIVIYSGGRRKDGSRGSKDPNKRKNVKPVEKEADSKKDIHSFASVTTTSTDAKESESNRVQDAKDFKTDKESCKHENLRVDVRDNDQSDDCLNIKNPLSSGQSLEKVDDTRIDPLREAKQMEENDVNRAPPTVVIPPQAENGTTSPLIQKSVEASAKKHEAGHDGVDDGKDNEGSCPESNGTRSDTKNLEKVDPASSVELLELTELKAIEMNRSEKTFISQKKSTSDIKLVSSKTLTQDTRSTKDPSSASLEAKSVTVSTSQKVRSVDKSQQHIDSKAVKSDEPPCGPIQHKVHKRRSESTPEAQSRSHGTVSSTSGALNQRKMTVSTVTKSSAGKPSNSPRPSVPDKARFSNTDSNGKRKKDTTFSDSPRSVDVSEKPKRIAKELLKSSSTPALKSSHLSRSSSHPPLSKKNSTDIKEPPLLSSSKTSSMQKTAATPESGDSANSELSVRGEKVSQFSRHSVSKNHLPHVHPPASTSTPSTLSDEELALLLHQELNSSPRVPRVPRMRNAGSLPQLASTTSTSTLMKRTSGGKDNGMVSRKRNKDAAKNAPSHSRESDRAKKVDRMPSLPNSRRHDHAKNGSAKVVHSPASTTASSGPSSSSEANEDNQDASDDDSGAAAHRTLPALLAEIMGKGKRMTYEELCNAVLPHWPNLRKHNGERYAYASHSQAVLDCLRNRSEWSRLVDRGPKTNGGGRKRRKPEADEQNLESEDDDYSTDRNTKEDTNDFQKGKRAARKQRRLARQGRGNKDVKRRRKAVSDDETESSSESSEESEFSDEEMQEGGTSGPNEASASSDETGS